MALKEIKTLPPLTDLCWRDVAIGKINPPWAMLAMKIMMTRITNSTKADPSPANVQKNAKDVRDFFQNNMKLAQKDLTAIVG